MVVSNQNGGLGSVVTPLVLRVIGGVVTVAWIASVIADALVPTYDPPETIGLAFMAMLSAVLGAAAVRSSNTSSGDDKKKGGSDDQ